MTSALLTHEVPALTLPLAVTHGGTILRMGASLPPLQADRCLMSSRIRPLIVALVSLLALGAAAIIAWRNRGAPRPVETATAPPERVDAPVSGPVSRDSEEAVRRREQMVARQLRGRDITDERVLAAIQRVPRHLFVPENWRKQAYDDRPLPIGHDPTISQPYIVALMTQLARPETHSRVLEVGTGSGYQAAVLAELAAEVYSIEIVCPLAEEASERLRSLEYRNVTVRCGDGYRGWPEHAPFDVILVTAAPDHIPQPLVDQLAVGGRLVVPVGEFFQELLVIEKDPDGTVRRRSIAAVRFVPMTGEARAGSPKSKR